MKTFVAISGSLRKDSHNTNLLRAAQELVGEKAQITIFDIATIPLYNQDLEVSFPSEAQALKDAILASDGVIFSTPEYNRSIPGVLKNAIDWASRPYGKNAFAGKKVLVLGASIGPISTALAQYHLKQVMNYLNAHVLGQPEFFMGPAGGKFDESGKLVDEPTREHLKSALDALIAA